MNVTLNKQVKVSVCVMTYNQKKFIGQCLQSLIDQEVNFDFEVIVSDDCSTDGTSDIVRAFAKKYPSIIRVVIHSKNIGAYNNYQFVHGLATGRYIAHMDGDDYALQGKLMTQSITLDQNSDVSLSTHAMLIPGEDRAIGSAANLPEFGTIQDLIKLGTYFSNSSTMYRKSNRFNHAPSIDIIDYYSHIEQASKGLIHLNKMPLGVYRIHPEGVSNNQKHRARIEKAYDLAFSRAIELNVPINLVMAGRLTRNKSFAINSLILGDTKGFREKIKINANEFQHASPMHRILHYGRYFTFGRFGVALVRKVLGL